LATPKPDLPPVPPPPPNGDALFVPLDANDGNADVAAPPCPLNVVAALANALVPPLPLLGCVAPNADVPPKPDPLLGLAAAMLCPNVLLPAALALLPSPPLTVVVFKLEPKLPNENADAGLSPVVGVVVVTVAVVAVVAPVGLVPNSDVGFAVAGVVVALLPLVVVSPLGVDVVVAVVALLVVPNRFFLTVLVDAPGVEGVPNENALFVGALAAVAAAGVAVVVAVDADVDAAVVVADDADVVAAPAALPNEPNDNLVVPVVALLVDAVVPAFVSFAALLVDVLPKENEPSDVAAGGLPVDAVAGVVVDVVAGVVVVVVVVDISGLPHAIAVNVLALVKFNKACSASRRVG